MNNLQKQEMERKKHTASESLYRRLVEKQYINRYPVEQSRNRDEPAMPSETKRHERYPNDDED
jgi:hypothetical protein